MLIGEIVVRDLDLLLRTAEGKVVPRDLGGNRYSHVLQVFLFGGKVAARGLDRAAHVTEEVQFPRSVKTRGIALGIDALTAESRLLLLGMCVAGCDRCMGRIVELGTGERSPGRADPIDGHGEIQVRVERPRDQLIQHRIVELLPPQTVR